jgi:hypothetical protein
MSPLIAFTLSDLLCTVRRRLLASSPRSGLHSRPELDICPSQRLCHAGCCNVALRRGVWSRECR